MTTDFVEAKTAQLHHDANQKGAMRHSILILVATLAACSTAPLHHGEPRPQNAAIEPIVEALISAAVSDFQLHPPPGLSGFRNVRVGHLPNPDTGDRYVLCGQFLAQQDGRSVWIPFATIQTSPYEQWVGAQAAEVCQRPAMVWHVTRDLAPVLQRELESHK